jgi:hypothetical protein
VQLTSEKGFNKARREAGFLAFGKSRGICNG